MKNYTHIKFSIKTNGASKYLMLLNCHRMFKEYREATEFSKRIFHNLLHYVGVYELIKDLFLFF